MDPVAYKDILKDIDTSAVAQSIATNSHNRILNGPCPEIANEEKTFSRIARTTLVQMRSGECYFLQDYLVKVSRSDSALCPECRYRRHSVPHLFACDASPTQLTVRDLWEKPVATAKFLKTPSFPLLPLPLGGRQRVI